uniref:Uncharacterized protein n=1 Tax=Aegilops tauschii subsp. strangulata TaxID=200361 RepID=A0A453E1L2_AEGTS
FFSLLLKFRIVVRICVLIKEQKGSISLLSNSQLNGLAKLVQPHLSVVA